MIRLIVRGNLTQNFTVERRIVQARKAVNRIMVVPAKALTAGDRREWVTRTVAFAPENGGTYRVDTRAAEVPVELPANPVDGFQFHLRDRAESWATSAAVLVRSNVAHKLAMVDADELGLDYNPGTLTVVFDAVLQNWGI